jgi:hypothetical protein
MNYNQFVNYIYSEGYIDDKDFNQIIEKSGSMYARGGYLEGREEYANFNYQIWYNPNKKGYSISDSNGVFDGDNNYFNTYDKAKEHAEISISSMLSDEEEMKEGGSTYAKGGSVLNQSKEFTSGNYYIGDLCYVMHDQWQEVCDITIVNNECLSGVFRLSNGTQFALYGTAFGDGVYYDEDGNEYGVDSGTLGCILISDINTSNKDNNIALGNEIYFDEPFSTGYLLEGDVIKFGEVEISSNSQTFDYDDDYNY